MNIPRLFLAIVAGFILVLGTDFLIHHIWMAPDYLATQQLWRPESEMGARFAWILAAQVLTVVSFVLLWTRWAPTAQLSCAVGFGFLMGTFSGVWALVSYAIQPLPGSIAAKWFVAGIVQCILLGIATFFIYKPKQPTGT